MPAPFDELIDANALINRIQALRLGSFISTRVLAEVPYGRSRLPLLAFDFGAQTAPAEAPLFILIGGVHGLERIGSQVVLSYLASVIERMGWDEPSRARFQELRMLVIPFVNPVGIARQSRSNGNDVDLMRNAPIDALGKTSFLVGGQRRSKRLPWHRGDADRMELEAQTVCDAVEAAKKNARFTLLLDVHSGFGIHDQVWFPYAKSAVPFPHFKELWGLKELFERTYPYNKYRFEPQSRHYTTHGDLWDYLYDRHFRIDPKSTELPQESRSLAPFLPLTLEMGSWAWVRKNPLQLFSALGPFHPMKPHRRHRILRRHLTLLDFLSLASRSHEAWFGHASLGEDEILRRWYR